MKKTRSQLFKELIKEAVREVLRAEFRTILREELQKVQPIMETTKHTLSAYPTKKRSYEEFLPKHSTSTNTINRNTPPVPVVLNSNMSTDPIKKLLADTAKNMTSEDYRTLANPGSQHAQMPINMSTIPMMSQNSNVDMNIGEIEEWTPTSIKMPQFPK